MFSTCPSACVCVLACVPSRWRHSLTGLPSTSSFLGRIACTQWCVRAPVCVVGHNRVAYENGLSDRDAVRGMGSGGAKEPCIRWGRIPQRKGQFLRYISLPVVKYWEYPACD